MTKLNITISETLFDIFEKWSCVEILVDGVVVGVFDDENGVRIDHTPENYEGKKLKYEITEFFNDTQWPMVDYSLIEEATTDYVIEKFVEEFGEKWVLLQNSYEKPESPGFCNTYGLSFSEEGEESTHGHEKACLLKDLDAAKWRDEIIDLVKNIEYNAPELGYSYQDFLP